MPLDRVNLDKICDYIPFVSSYTNIVDLIQKKRFAEKTSMEDPPLLKNRYVTHIENKSDIRCAILIIPVIGNVVVGFWDLVVAFASLFQKENDEDEQKAFLIGKPSGFKHVNSGAVKKKEDEDEPENLSARIDAKIELYREKEMEEEIAELNAQDIYGNPPVLKSKLDDIPAKERRAYLESLGFSPKFYDNEDYHAKTLLSNLARNIAPKDKIREKYAADLSETEFLRHLRDLPVEEVKNLIISIAQESSIFRQKFLIFLMLDPRLRFDSFINENLSNTARHMIEIDASLNERLSPLIRS